MADPNTFQPPAAASRERLAWDALGGDAKALCAEWVDDAEGTAEKVCAHPQKAQIFAALGYSTPHHRALLGIEP